VFTLSLHCEAQSFPELSHRSDLDVALPAGCTDDHYLSTLRAVLPTTLAEFKPELVLYNAGVDVHAEDALGKMAMTNAGILERDRFVFAQCAQHGVPVAAAIGGGYSPKHELIVDRHVLLHQAAAEHAQALLRATRLGGAGPGGRAVESAGAPGASLSA
jgi:acetoin utilization deacetylase AcuC-like enzyme